MPSLRKRHRSADVNGEGQHIERFLFSDAALVTKSSSSSSITLAAAHPVTGSEVGDGTPLHPHSLPLRSSPNASECYHCYDDTCKCTVIAAMLSDTYDRLPTKRITEVARSRELCAKSLLPPFVARFIRLMNITRDTTFFDLGCGNGSILFQVACVTGAKCIGIEISESNARLAKDAWPVFKKQYEKQFGKTTGTVTVLTGDITEYMAKDDFYDSTGNGIAILLSNLLFPKPLTHYISERLRTAPIGTRVLCFDDLYPHGRSVSAKRDPEAFELFEMKDYTWQEMSVEWCAMEGRFYIHWRK